MTLHIIFRAGSLWIGGHWSAKNRRLCFNPVPCITFALTFRGGVQPTQGKIIWTSKEKS